MILTDRFVPRRFRVGKSPCKYKDVMEKVVSDSPIACGDGETVRGQDS